MGILFKKKNDNKNVDHPSHYNIEGKRECIVAMEEDYGPEVTFIFCLTNAYKYIYRKGNKRKNPETRDKSKAMWYADYAFKIHIKNPHLKLEEKYKSLFNFIYMALVLGL